MEEFLLRKRRKKKKRGTSSLASHSTDFIIHNMLAILLRISALSWIRFPYSLKLIFFTDNSTINCEGINAEFAENEKCHALSEDGKISSPKVPKYKKQKGTKFFRSFLLILSYTYIGNVTKILALFKDFIFTYFT